MTDPEDNQENIDNDHIMSNQIVLDDTADFEKMERLIMNEENDGNDTSLSSIIKEEVEGDSWYKSTEKYKERVSLCGIKEESELCTAEVVNDSTEKYAKHVGVTNVDPLHSLRKYLQIVQSDNLPNSMLGNSNNIRSKNIMGSLEVQLADLIMEMDYASTQLNHRQKMHLEIKERDFKRREDAMNNYRLRFDSDRKLAEEQKVVAAKQINQLKDKIKSLKEQNQMLMYSNEELTKTANDRSVMICNERLVNSELQMQVERQNKKIKELETEVDDGKRLLEGRKSRNMSGSDEVNGFMEKIDYKSDKDGKCTTYFSDGQDSTKFIEMPCGCLHYEYSNRDFHWIEKDSEYHFYYFAMEDIFTLYYNDKWRIVFDVKNKTTEIHGSNEQILVISSDGRRTELMKDANDEFVAQYIENNQKVTSTHLIVESFKENKATCWPNATLKKTINGTYLFNVEGFKFNQDDKGNVKIELKVSSIQISLYAYGKFTVKHDKKDNVKTLCALWYKN
uniref:Uncharacterized protein n=1 Tax=Rhabditophanes sp. KR3021 TaxID=114890 RepID=A0AC35UBS4_9BILA